MVNGLHDAVQTLVHLAGGPVQAHGVLAHLQAAGGHATGVRRLARGEQNAGLEEQVDRLQRRRHVGALGDADAAIAQQRTGILGVQLVLRRAWQRDIAGQVPRPLAGVEAQAGAFEFAQTAATHVLQLHQRFQLLQGLPGLVDQGAFGVGQRHHPPAQLDDLLRGVLGHIARAGNGHAQALEIAATGLEHFLGEVHAAVAGGFRADQAAAVGQALAGQHRGELVGQALVLAEQEADLPAAHADITGRHIDIGTHVAIQLAHERLAEPHHFRVALALGIEVRAALAAAHGQRGQRVLEDLFEGEELEHAQVHRRVETQAALVRADGAAHLYPETTVDLHPAGIVDPRHTEHDRPLGLDDTLQHAGFAVMRVGVEERPQGTQHLFHRLVEFGLIGVAALEPLEECVNGLGHVYTGIFSLCDASLPADSSNRERTATEQHDALV
ncbi:MAG: hypothetical protein GAK43_00973 [Stenotrophomonas maltophilia]|nr:MAG: hypothetical protein GAK43_00973 [Stenotrophomonas maltophilia]